MVKFLLKWLTTLTEMKWCNVWILIKFFGSRRETAVMVRSKWVARKSARGPPQRGCCPPACRLWSRFRTRRILISSSGLNRVLHCLPGSSKFHGKSFSLRDQLFILYKSPLGVSPLWVYFCCFIWPAGPIFYAKTSGFEKISRAVIFFGECFHVIKPNPRTIRHSVRVEWKEERRWHSLIRNKHYFIML